jgi:hypothetical protein
VEVVSAFAPATAIPLFDGGRDVTCLADRLFSPQWELPAHVGLHGHVARATLYGGVVKRTSCTGVKIGSVEEDTGIVDQASGDRSISVGLRDAPLCLGFELPFFVRQGCSPTFNFGHIGIVNEMRTIRTAALDKVFGWAGEDSLAALAKDARPVGGEKRHVEDPRACFFRVVETDPLMKVIWQF